MAFTGLGSGILGDPYQITTWAQFKEIKDYLAAHFKLMNNITATNGFGIPAGPFTGMLDGNEKSLLDIQLNGSASNTLLFPINNGTIKNINISTAQPYAIFGLNANIMVGTFENVYIYGTSTNGIHLCWKMDSCNISNTRIKATGEAKLAVSVTNSTFNNVLIQSYSTIAIGASANGILTNNSFTDCKFVCVNNLKGVTNAANGIKTFHPKANTYTGCLFYAPNPYIVENGGFAEPDKNTYVRCSFISNYIGTNENAGNYAEYFLGTINGDMSKCYFGGKLKFLNSANYPYTIRINNNLYNFTAYDCHFDIRYEETYSVSMAYPYVSLINNNGSRNFVNSTVVGFDTIASTSLGTVTDSYINSSRLNIALVTKGSYNAITEAQTLNAASFANFDFVNVWEIQEGVFAPKLRNVIYDASPYLPEDVLSSIVLTRVNTTSEKITINTLWDNWPGTLKCYVANTLAGLENPINEKPITQISAKVWESTVNLPEGKYYVLVVYQYGVFRQEQSSNAYHYTIDELPITVKNIVAPNYVQLSGSNPIGSSIHGTLYHNGYIYLSARGGVETSASIIKINATDFSLISSIKVYTDKTNVNSIIYRNLDQIVYCQGFIWAMSQTNNGALLRINPDTLDYIVFALPEASLSGEPIGTDGTYLYLPCSTKVYKIDTSLLLANAAAYNYSTFAVNMPINTVIGNCVIPIQFERAYVHSICVDAANIYLAITSTVCINGINDSGQNVCHFQKINKLTMETVGDIPIPRSTDDMVQDDNFVYLVPELTSNTASEIYGKYWGVYAIKKSNLQIKPLPALHKKYHTSDCSLKAGYGVQSYQNYIAIQTITNKETIVVSKANVNNWNENLPIGSETVEVLKFQINGVDLTVASNELITGNDGVIYANTWEINNTRVYKFTDDYLSVLLPPVVQSVLIQSLINSTTIGGFIVSPGSSPVTQEGLQYGTDKNNLDQTIITDGTPINFSAILNLTPGIYFFRAYATNAVGTSYGTTIPFLVGNNIILSSGNNNVVLDIKSDNYGLAVRCCKPAPGVADGVTGTVTDVDGNVYDTIVINEIEWITSDLAVTKYNNNDAIPNLTNAAEWQETVNGAYCSYLNL